ncbi:hypothetical protein Asulf_00582 [Archaeoglobus sulfaticallidus PM70-1]|uniref:Uncharacterized protein n=1 Tax=Archaeoglobus sulfaticallidus PM70-1 TaxID=387631 RepID=N0BED2_9EURY|nr:hypothetical protein [Archaeoglobus sulfaticallidus]AGK60602.1 hypothetical protein Asulf_00582 [Archaeoglobus sulfaticallidus PM70-1]
MNLLRPFGELDVLGLYSGVAKHLKDFLKGKEIASKTWVKAKIPFFLNRAGKLGPLWINDFDYIDQDFLRIRAKHHLNDVRSRLDERQILLWKYFAPRKYSEFFYATNGEGEGREIERVFIDIDRTNLEAEKSLEVTRLLLEIVEEHKEQDDEMNDLIKSLAVYWTGSSFHLYMFLTKPQPPEFYEEKIQYHRETLFKSWTDAWVRAVKEKVGFKVTGGHEKKKDSIVIDPSQTPSGKLARVPLGCLHMKDFEPDGVSIPMNENMIYDDGIVEWLKGLAPEYVVKHAERFSRYLWSYR